MGEVPPQNLPLNTPPLSQEELERLQLELVKAQAAETVATTALSEYNRGRQIDEAVLAGLVADVQAARERAQAAYEAWNVAAKTFYTVASSKLVQ